MSILFERILTPGIAQLSYLIGDDSVGVAAVIDPRPDCDIYIRLAREHGVSITHVFETHIHADFMSGARELVERLGSAELCASGEAGPEYGFALRKIKAKDRFSFGSVILTTRFTPGHTPEHVSYEIAEEGSENSPWGVFTGDSLFVGSAGRPDLMGEEETDDLTRQLFTTLRDYYLKLDDGVIIYPCHGAGSACGAAIGDRPMSTIGYERLFNKFLQFDDENEFAKFVKEGAPPEPHHYKRLKKLNAEGPPILRNLPWAPALPPERFLEAVEAEQSTLVDTRQMLAFGGGHIFGAMNIGPRPELSVWAGQMLDPQQPILLVLEDESNLDYFLRLFWRTGFVRFTGYLAGGMKAWDNAGLPLQKVAQMTVHEVKAQMDELQLLDVRAPDEWEKGRIPGARHFFVAEMREGLDGVAGFRKDRPLVTYCDSGYRANLAASLLQEHGFRDVRNIPGSWQAWTKAGYPTEK